MSMATIGIASLALTGISMAVSYSGALSPSQPNLSSSSRELSNTQAQLLPWLRGMEAAAAKGEDYTFALPPGIRASDLLSSPLFAQGGEFEGLQGIIMRTIQDGIGANGKYTISFKGYGTADTQGKLATQNAQNALALSHKYDSQFIQSALEQEKLADPEGFAARQRMHELITEQADREPNHPVSDLLERQVGDQLKAGRGLDDFDKEALDRAVAQATGARGGAGEGANFEQPLTTGAMGEARATAARRKALAFAASGSTPEDIDYRRRQQDMANLSSEVNGVTPQSQFATLSGAQNGPTPQVNGNALPTMPGNTVAQAGANAVTGYNQAMAQPNQWMAGLSALLNTAGAAGQAGAFGG